MQWNPCRQKTNSEKSPSGAKPIKSAYTKCGCRNATALQRIGCRAVVPRQPHIIYSRIANADIHGFRIANAEERVANAEEQRDCLRVIPHHGQGALKTLRGGYRRHNSTNLNKDSHRTSYNTSSCCHNANLTSSSLFHHLYSGTKTLRDNL